MHGDAPRYERPFSFLNNPEYFAYNGMPKNRRRQVESDEMGIKTFEHAVCHVPCLSKKTLVRPRAALSFGQNNKRTEWLNCHGKGFHSACSSNGQGMALTLPGVRGHYVLTAVG